MRLRDEGGKVVDVAFDFVFDSHEGFTRAFSREFGVSPQRFVQNRPPIQLFFPSNVRETYLALQKGEIQMSEMMKTNTIFVQVVDRPARKLILKRGVKAEDYFAYCEEVGCEVWGVLTAVQHALYERPDFWATTSNKQLNFLQHIKTLLAINGRAAVVVPDNVLFEGGAGETIRRKLLAECEVHTMLRLPTGIFYAQGVKANVLFFERRPAAEKAWTEQLWVYDLRTNLHFTLRTNPLRYEHLADFVQAYHPENRRERAESERFHCFNYADLVARDKASLDIFWLKDDSLEDSENLPDPHVLALEIVENLEAALEQFRGIVADLGEE